MVTPVRKAVFPVAGFGTRFLPATKAMPKEMLPVVDKPLIQYAVEEAEAAGIEEFIFVTGRGKTPLEDHFDRSAELEATLEGRGKEAELESIVRWVPTAGHVAYTRQQEPLGLGHAVWCARRFVGDEPFAVILADDLVQAEVPCLKQLVDAYGQTGGNVVAVMDVPREQTSRYGILDIGSEEGASAGGNLVEVKGLVEKPAPEDAPSTLSIIGRYILQPEVLDRLDERVSQMATGAGGEIQLTDAMAEMIGTTPFHGVLYEGRRFDCGDKVGFLMANVAFALERPDIAPGLAAFLRDLDL